MSETSWLEAERARSRRPITGEEVRGLEALGDEVRRLRWDVARLHRPALAVRAEISVRQIEQIERAIRRTRRSTLERIVRALVKVQPVLGDPEALVERLLSLAGAGVAPESEYRERGREASTSSLGEAEASRSLPPRPAHAARSARR